MERLKEVLREHTRRYPHMECRDYGKLIYQNEWGCGHMITSPKRVLELLQEEYASDLPQADECVPIGNGLCRAPLGGADFPFEQAELLCLLFCATANTHKGSADAFLKKLSLLQSMADEGELAVSGREMRAFLQEYERMDRPSLHHSERCRREYHPHYRVIREAYLRFLPALRLCHELTRKKAGALLAVDGRCASGKSFLSGLLREVFGAEVLRMDDFFLPAQAKTKERLEQAGGNVDWERFEQEVLRPLSRGEAAHYQPFDCKKQARSEDREISPGKLFAVEGSYALHPALRQYYDAAVFLTCAPSVQRERLLRRNGETMLSRFETEWIPLEEAYFMKTQTEQAADLILDTSAFPEA